MISLLARRPLLSIAATKLAHVRRGAAHETQTKLESPGTHRTPTMLTAAIGATCVTDAAAQIVLALTVSTSTFGVGARVASYVIIGTGIAVCVLYVRWSRTRLQHQRMVTAALGIDAAAG